MVFQEQKATRGCKPFQDFWGVMAYAIGAIFGNYFLIYLGAIIVLAFSIIPTFFIKESKALTIPEEETVITEKKSKVTQWGELFKLYFAHGFSWIGVQTMFVYIIAYIQQKLNPASEMETGQIIAISFLVLNAVGFILPAFVLEPITEKIGRVKTHLACVAIMSLGYFGIVLIGTSSIILYILMAVCGIGWAAIVSLPFAIMSEKVDESRMGFFMGIFNLSVVLPQLIVSLVLGYFIQEAQDKNLIFIISGTTLAISAILWLLVKRETSENSGIIFISFRFILPSSMLVLYDIQSYTSCKNFYLPMSFYLERVTFSLTICGIISVRIYVVESGLFKNR